MSLDDLDGRIVTAMATDSRVSLRELADTLGLSEAVVRNRVRALEKHGVLRKYVPSLDYEALGYSLTVVLRMWVDGDHLTALTERLRAERRLISVYEVTGQCDVIAIGKYADGDELTDQWRQLLSDPAVYRVETTPVQTAVSEYEQVDLASPGEE